MFNVVRRGSASRAVGSQTFDGPEQFDNRRLDDLPRRFDLFEYGRLHYAHPDERSCPDRDRTLGSHPPRPPVVEGLWRQARETPSRWWCTGQNERDD